MSEVNGIVADGERAILLMLLHLQGVNIGVNELFPCISIVFICEISFFFCNWFAGNTLMLLEITAMFLLIRLKQACFVITCPGWPHG